jgi:hypothetical protein
LYKILTFKVFAMAKNIYNQFAGQYQTTAPVAKLNKHLTQHGIAPTEATPNVQAMGGGRVKIQ